MNLLSQMYNITSREGSLIIDNEDYKQKVLGWLGHDKDLYKQVLNQTIISIYNKYTREEVVYNPLRAKRPVADTGASELAEIEKLYFKTKPSCDFCRAKRYTAQDKAGRLETPLSITAANTFRYEAVHQLIIPKKHHPLNWTQTEFLDMFNLAGKWLQKEFHKDMAYSYPLIDWDLLPPSGASQYHPHLQAILTPNRYPGVPETWRLAAIDYHRAYDRNYFNDLIAIHDQLGLTVRYKSAVAIAILTPKKENEVVIIANEMSNDYLQLLYGVLRTFIDDKKLYSFSLAMALPPFTDVNIEHEEGSVPTEVLPAFTRVVTRGKMSELRSDISSLELLTFSNVNSDPFILVKQIQKSVDSRLTQG